MEYDVMANQNYKPFIKSHPNLKERLENGFNYYEPFFHLGQQLIEKLPRELDKLEDGSKNIDDYIPLVNDPMAEVANEQNERLRLLLCKKVPQIPWPGKAKDKNKVLQAFWYCYRRYLNPSTDENEVFIRVGVLNILSIFLEFDNFFDFIERQYPPVPSFFNIVLLPLQGLDQHSQFVDEGIRNTIYRLVEEVGSEVKLVNYEKPWSTSLQDFPSGRLAALDKTFLGSLLIWGKLQSPSHILLQCCAQNEVWAEHHGSWSTVFSLDSLHDQEAKAFKKIQLSVYWCLFNRNFFLQRYHDSYDYLKKAVDLGLDNYEIPFRVGVLQDLLDNAGKARLEYLNLLNLIGVEDAHQQLRDMFLRRVDPKSQDTGTGIFISGDYVKLTDITVGYPEYNPNKKLMYFEIVRMKLFSQLKNKLEPESFERVLEKIVANTKGEWLDSKNKPLFGEANFEMGKLLRAKIEKRENVDASEMLSYFEKAVVYSADESIHQYCLVLFQNIDKLDSISELVSKAHPGKDNILQLYKR